MKLSIIVPVYNVENYLAKCLDSLLNQDIPKNEYEIIIVNDGSTDGSAILALKYVDLNSNISLITQENKGLGGARNRGIREAKGKYLFFVDSDDYIQPNCLGTLLACFEKNQLEVIRFNYEAVDENYDIIPKAKSATYSIRYSEEVVTGEVFFAEYLGWACYAWVYFFDSSFIKTNGLFFHESIYFEDVEWLVRVLLLTKRIQSLDFFVYNYLQRSGSITKGVDEVKLNKVIDDKVFIINFLKEHALRTSNKKLRSWFEASIALTCMSLLGIVERQMMVRKSEIIKLVRSKTYFPLKTYRFTPKQLRNVFLINLSPELFCYLLRK